MTKNIATTLVVGFFVCVLTVMTAQAKCVLRGTPPFCEGECLPGETTGRVWVHGVCATGVRVECCTPDASEAHPATQDKKSSATGAAATELDTGAKQDKKTSGVGNAATEVIHPGKKDKKTPGVGNAATEVVQKPATPASPAGGSSQQQRSSDDEDDNGHHHKNHKHKHHHHDD
jgi:hypothetical protein